jgi:hypothetical protein
MNQEKNQIENTTTQIELQVIPSQKLSENAEFNPAKIMLTLKQETAKTFQELSENIGFTKEEWLSLSIEPSEVDASQPKLLFNTNAKLTKADAGRTA